MVDKLNGTKQTSNYPASDRIDPKKTAKPKDSESLYTKAREHYKLTGENLEVDNSKVYSGNEVDWYLDDKTGVIRYEQTPDGTISTLHGSHPSDLPQELIDKENAKSKDFFPTGKLVEIDEIPPFDDIGMVDYMIGDE